MPAIPIIAIGASVAGTAMSAVSSMQQGRDQAANSMFNAQIAEANAKQAEINAAQQIQAASEEESRFRVQSHFLLARQRSAAGASGIRTDTGSPLTVGAEQAKQLELGALDIRYAGTLAARAEKIRAKGFTVDASYHTRLAEQYRQAGLMGAAAAIIGGASRTFDLIGGYRKSKDERESANVNRSVIGTYPLGHHSFP